MTPWLRRVASGALLLSAGALYAHGRDREFVARPYLAVAGTGRLAVRGFTRTPERWSVVPILPGSPYGQEAAPTTRHQVVLDRLPSDRTVEVEVVADGRPVDGGRLRLRTDPGPAAPWLDFVVVGDSGGAPDRFEEFFGKTTFQGAYLHPERLAMRMSEVRPQLVLHGGDVVDPRGERDGYARAFFRPFGPLLATAPVAAAIGERDLESEDGLPFLDVFGRTGSPPLSEGKYGSFDYGPLHVAVLDSNEADADLGSRQAQWLEADLRASTRPWKVALTHVPLWFSSREQREARTRRQQELCDALRVACERGGASVVFAAHHPWYERSPPVNGVVHVVTGGGGSRLSAYDPGAYAFAASYFHFVSVHIEGDAMTIRPLRETGQEIARETPQGVEPGGVRIERRR
ncbi:MAG TPA: metallophosphoesterase [Planctomycetota bacterium]|nr:metallophosphoesterase [Planctomycetota bacterium]